jgi:hypothetical protein
MSAPQSAASISHGVPTTRYSTRENAVAMAPSVRK